MRGYIGEIRVIYAPIACFRFSIWCSIPKAEPIKSNRGQKSCGFNPLIQVKMNEIETKLCRFKVHSKTDKEPAYNTPCKQW